jgi:leucyl aminopeptidase (aminopeptidase T)
MVAPPTPTPASGFLRRSTQAASTAARSQSSGSVPTPAATLTGNVLEDEKVIDTMHLALGTSTGIGGVNIAGVHIDGIVLHPTVELDAERVLDDGRLRVA